MGTPIHVVGGFLGAGKTTVLRRWLDALGQRERVAVVVNDFGESGYDGAVLGETGGVRIEEIRGGCVCCTAPSGFVGAVRTLLDEVRPDRIFVEPTGLARPADLVDMLRRADYRARLDLRPLVVLVDPRALGEALVAEQADAADILVGSQWDRASESERAAFDAFAKERWPGPLRVVHAAHGEVDRDVLDWPETQKERPFSLRPLAPSTAGFEAITWRWPADVIFDRRRLTAALAELPGVVRLKGVFRTDEGTWAIEVASGRRDEKPSPVRRESGCDVIGRGGATPFQALREAVDATQRTGTAAADVLEVVRPDGVRVELDRAALAALPDDVPDVSTLFPKRAGRAARVRAVLERAGAAGATDAVVVASDGFASPPVPVDLLAEGVVVHSLGDGPLPADQGGPFRLLIAGNAGPAGACSNVKGVVRLALRIGDRASPVG